MPHNKTQPSLSIHGLYILSDNMIARGKVFMWSKKMWIHCSKCLGLFRPATDFLRIGNCYVSYEFVHIADKWNQNGWTEYKIIYNFWKVVWNITVCEKWMYFVKKTQLILEFSFAFLGTSAAIESIFCHRCSVDWRKEPFPCWNYQSSDSNKKHILRKFRATTSILWFQTIPYYFKKFVHLRSTRLLPKRKEQLLQH
jgi:hypothetical protein